MKFLQISTCLQIEVLTLAEVGRLLIIILKHASTWLEGLTIGSKLDKLAHAYRTFGKAQFSELNSVNLKFTLVAI